MLFEDQTGGRQPRDERGRVISRACPDTNCGGHLVHAGAGEWHCDGLTHDRDDGLLVECKHSHTDGEPIVERQAQEWAAGRIWSPVAREFRPALSASNI
jgi:hypothetical protein